MDFDNIGRQILLIYNNEHITTDEEIKDKLLLDSSKRSGGCIDVVNFVHELTGIEYNSNECRAIAETVFDKISLGFETIQEYGNQK